METTTSPLRRSDHTVDDEMVLLDRWRRGDRRSAQILIRRHYRPVKRYFAASIGGEICRDLTQDTFRKVTEKIDKFEGRSSFRTYLFAIARYTLYDHLKKSYKGPGNFEPLEQSIIDHGAVSPSQMISDVREQHVLLSCMEALPVETKNLLVMFYWQDFTAKEICEISDLTIGQIKGRLAAAKKKLAKEMAEAESRIFSESDIEHWLRDLLRFFESGPKLKVELDSG